MSNWVKHYYSVVDSMNVEEFTALHTEDVRLRFGNAETVVGRDAVVHGITDFWGAIKGLRRDCGGAHRLYPPRWEGGDPSLHYDLAQEGRSRSRPPYLYGCLSGLRLIHTIRATSIEPCSSLYYETDLGRRLLTLLPFLQES